MKFWNRGRWSPFTRASVLGPCVALGWIAGAGASATAQQSVIRGSVASDGSEAPRESTAPALSRDARFVAFESDSQRLTLRDLNGLRDVFLRDTHARTTQLVSADPTGRAVGGNGPRISDDGRKVAFVSSSPALTSGAFNGQSHVFVRDMLLGATTIASVGPSGGQLASGVAHGQFDLSGDGNVLAFVSSDSQILPGDNDLDADLFVRDLVSGAVVCATLDFNGQVIASPAPVGAVAPKLSRDGRYCVFHSNFATLVPGDTNESFDVFVFDRVTATTTRVSVSSSGAQGDGTSWISSISATGRWVSFQSSATTFAPNASNEYQAYLHDRATGITELLSVNSAGAGALGGASTWIGAAISEDGRWVSFQSDSPDLSNSGQGVFVRDRLLGATTRVDVPIASSTLDGPSAWPSLSGDGRWVAFASSASQLAPGDNNGVVDVFLASTPANAPTSFCSAGTSSNGCSATLSVVGQPRVGGAAPCSLVLAQADGQSSTHLFYGLAAFGSAPPSWGGGSGFLCVKAPYQRIALAATQGSNGLCDGAVSFDWRAYQLAQLGALGQPFAPTLQLYVQAWVRDASAPGASNLSNATTLPFLP